MAHSILKPISGAVVNEDFSDAVHKLRSHFRNDFSQFIEEVRREIERQREAKELLEKANARIIDEHVADSLLKASTVDD